MVMGALSGLLLVIKLPLDDEYGQAMPDSYQVEGDVEAFPVRFNPDSIHWTSSSKKHVELNLSKMALDQGEMDTDWFVVALSSKTGEVVRKGVLHFV